MQKSTVIKLIQKMIEKQEEELSKQGDNTYNGLYRTGAKDAYTHALLLITEMELDD